MGTVSIPLTQGKVAIIDEEDLPLVSRHKWHAHQHHSGSWYASTNVPTGLERPRQRMLKMHNLLLPSPAGMMVDHRDGDALNNARANLRLATNAQNCFNRRIYSTSKTGYKGVIWRRDMGKYVVKMGYQGRQYHIGVYNTAEEAAQAYDEQAKEWYGEFARLNLP